jgi:hypothetical protein
MPGLTSQIIDILASSGWWHYILIRCYQLFGGTYCLSLQLYPEDAGRMFLRSIVNHLCYNQDDYNMNLHRRENLKSPVRYSFCVSQLGAFTSPYVDNTNTPKCMIYVWQYVKITQTVEAFRRWQGECPRCNLALVPILQNVRSETWVFTAVPVYRQSPQSAGTIKCTDVSEELASHFRSSDSTKKIRIVDICCHFDTMKHPNDSTRKIKCRWKFIA